MTRFYHSCCDRSQCFSLDFYLAYRSAIQQLLSIANIVQEALTANKCVIYLDFKMAFNSVPHNKLCSYFQSCGHLELEGNSGTGLGLTLDQGDSVWVSTTLYLTWYLSYQEFRKVVYLAHSFLLHSSTMHVTLAWVFLFADDTKCFKIISNPSDIISLQNYINQALNWSNINDLFFNESKFLHIHFKRSLAHTVFLLMEHLLLDTTV